MNHRAVFSGVFLVAFATLLIEVSIIRVLSFTIWHHFGYVIISTALLGYGASGTLLALRSSIGRADLMRTLARLALLSALSTAGVLLFIGSVPLDPIQVFERPREAIVFLAYLVGTAVPFFFSGLAISLALREAADRVDRLYFWDLLGGGIGCMVAVAVMNALSPPGAVMVAGAGFALAACVFARPGAERTAGALLAVLSLASAPVAHHLAFKPAASKQLSIQLDFMRMQPVASEWTALFRTDLIENVEPKPDHCELGVSVRLPPERCEIPRYYMAHDATAGAAIYDSQRYPTLNSIDYSIFKGAYLMAPPNPRVMVIGVGGGRDILVALQFGASHVTGVDLDPVLFDMLLDLPASRDAFSSERVDLVVSEGRRYARSAPERFDLIQLTGVDTLAAEYSGAYVLAENYLYTVESFTDYLRRLTPGGVLSIAPGDLNPLQPRSTGRMVSVAREALRGMGIERPQDHIAVIDSHRLRLEVIIRPQPFTREDSIGLARWAKQMQFTPLHLPYLKTLPLYAGLAGASGAELDRLLANQRHRLDATTDDTPFFFSFYRWGDLFRERTLSPSHVTALGQIIIAALIVILTSLGGLFIIAPLIVFRRRGAFRPGALPMLGYFLAVGFGFMLFEISLIQRFVLFLGYPTYSLTVTLFSLLVSLGFGSFLSRRWVGRERVALPVAVVLIALLGLFYAFVMPGIQDALFAAALAVRIATSVALLVPLGLVLGVFFPLGVRCAAQIHEDLVPWAWAINGCASVTAGVSTIALAMTFGFPRVWAASVVVYGLGVACFLLALRRREAAAHAG